LRLLSRRVSVEKKEPVTSSEVTFEHKLKVNKDCRHVAFGPAESGRPIFTESLILAQDERWRRA
jgi:hypothetical protein